MSSNRPRAYLVIAVSAAAVVSSCSTEVPGQAGPPASPSSRTDSTAGAPAGKRAPKVTRPLDAAKYIADPCASLTQAQQGEFRVLEPGERTDINGDPNCRWQLKPDGATSVGVTYAVKVTNGLSNLYALDSTGWWKNGYFTPTTVSDYPAAYNEIADHRTQGDCILSVAISDSLFFSTAVRSRAGDDSCLAAKNAAAAVLDTIKKGA
ncbi:DUF3558 domain-containing protein [Amycolatopsis sp. NPDC059021]|uniref:DUF3558 domain-containing protein n=1 Tax=Amycolatopsis sp. NPDC059021 TaxID=3346704 RepID=UPI00366D847D